MNLKDLALVGAHVSIVIVGASGKKLEVEARVTKFDSNSSVLSQYIIKMPSLASMNETAPLLASSHTQRHVRESRPSLSAQGLQLSTHFLINHFSSIILFAETSDLAWADYHTHVDLPSSCHDSCSHQE